MLPIRSGRSHRKRPTREVHASRHWKLLKPAHLLIDHATFTVTVVAGLTMSSQTSTQSTPLRYEFTRQILGPALFERIQTAKVLVVGAGGIGCEVLKDLVVAGFGHIEIIDLDTIDLSNLNRQFLFNKSHIKKSKSLVAASVAGAFNPNVTIVPYHGNIKEPQFGYDFFKRFDVVLNALDNLDARRWVNRMCIATGVPLVESGTTGFLGQVQPIVKDIMACYDCSEKPVQKTYPVCTIRSTPTTPIHCVVWAKTWLFSQLFGLDDETEAVELDKAEADGGNSEEIDALRKEALEMRNLRATLTEPGAAQRVFDKVFQQDIERLLSMDEMWKHRKRPTALSFDAAIQTSPSASSGSSLRDQTQLGLRETAELFQRSLEALAKRAASNSAAEPLSFDKDDDDALDFVTASSNLRSRIYAIETKTRFDIKQMAGNIIPAIASTNAIISGALVLQSLHMLQRAWSSARDVMLGKSVRFILSGTETSKPQPTCGVCADVYVRAQVSDLTAVTLGQLIERAQVARQEGGLGLDDTLELGVYEGARLLADPDFEDNLEKPLSQLGIDVGKFLSLVDEDGVKATVQLVITSPSNAEAADSEGDSAVVFPSEAELPTLRDRPQPPKPADDSDSDDEGVQAAKDEDDGFEVEEDQQGAAARHRAAAAASTSIKRNAEAQDEDAEKRGKKRRLESVNETTKGQATTSGAGTASAPPNIVANGNGADVHVIDDDDDDGDGDATSAAVTEGSNKRRRESLQQ
ncbi:unnamed protein product [Parajaminaea phylloscopi]